MILIHRSILCTRWNRLCHPEVVGASVLRRHTLMKNCHALLTEESETPQKVRRSSSNQVNQLQFFNRFFNGRSEHYGNSKGYVSKRCDKKFVFRNFKFLRVWPASWKQEKLEANRTGVYRPLGSQEPQEPCLFWFYIIDSWPRGLWRNLIWSKFLCI